MTQKTLKEVEPIALEFAKSILSHNSNIEPTDLIATAVKYAMAWLDNDELKEHIILLNQPNWVKFDDSNEVDYDKFCKPSATYQRHHDRQSISDYQY